DLTIWNLPPLTTAAGVYVLLFVVAGAPGVVMEAGLVSFLQLAGPEHQRGRVFGALTLADNAGQAVGMVAAGLLTAPLGLMGLLNAQGCLYLAAGGLAVGRVARYPAAHWRTPRQTARRGAAPAAAPGATRSG